MKPHILIATLLVIAPLVNNASPVAMVEAREITAAFEAAGIPAFPSGGSTHIRQTYAKGFSAFYHIRVDASLARIRSVIPEIAKKIKSEIIKSGLELRSETPLQDGAYPTDQMYQVIFDSPKLKGVVSLSALETSSGTVLVVTAFEIE